MLYVISENGFGGKNARLSRSSDVIFVAFVLKCFFGAQKGAFKAKYQPLLWGIFHDIYKLAWSEHIL